MYLGRMISQLWLNLDRRDVIPGTNASVHHKRLEITTPEAEKGRVAGRQPGLIVRIKLLPFLLLDRRYLVLEP